MTQEPVYGIPRRVHQLCDLGLSTGQVKPVSINGEPVPDLTLAIDDKNWLKQASEHLFFCQSMYVCIYLYYILAVTVTVTVCVTVPAVPIAY
jgi:hypothetical protein